MFWVPSIHIGYVPFGESKNGLGRFEGRTERKVLKNRPAMRVCSYWVLVCIGMQTVVFSVYSYFKKGFRKAYALI